MDLTIFEEALDRFGGDLARWPAADRAAAATLIAGSDTARAMLAAMANVEELLRASTAAAGEDGIGSMAARAMLHRQETPARRLALRAGWAAAAAAVLVLGIAIGELATSAHYDEPDHVMAMVFDAGGAADVD